MDEDASALLALLASDLDQHFTRLAASHQHKLYSFALRLGLSPQDAEDTVQEALLRGYIALSQYPKDFLHKLHLRPWLYKITYHVFCKNQQRAHLQLLPLEGEDGGALERPDDEQVQPEVLYELTERRRELEQAVARLTPCYRDVVVCVYFEQLSYQETAHLLDLALGTVRSRLHRGLKQLHQYLSSERSLHYGLL